MSSTVPITGGNSEPSVRVLLDSNVWTALVSADEVDDLAAEARLRGWDIQVAPCVVHEQLRTPDDRLRAGLVEATTRVGWIRLMPEIYLESAEFVEAVRRHRPDWLRDPPGRREYAKLEKDWTSANGAWGRTRAQPHREAKRLEARGWGQLELARDDGQQARDHIREQGIEKRTTLQLSEMHATKDGSPVLLDGARIPAWRAGGHNCWTEYLRRRGGSPREWVLPWVDLNRVAADRAEWDRFWFADVQVAEVPRVWLRWAVTVLQSLRRYGRGNAGDAQLTAHLLDTDVVVSADGRFSDIARDMREQAPFHTAPVRRVVLDGSPLSALAAAVAAEVNENDSR